MKKVMSILVGLGMASNLLAQEFEVTLNCHVATGFSYKHVKVVVDVPYMSDAKTWAKEHGEEACKKYAPGTWYDGIYNLQYK